MKHEKTSKTLPKKKRKKPLKSTDDQNEETYDEPPMYQ